VGPGHHDSWRIKRSDHGQLRNYVKGNSANLAGIYVASEGSYGTAAPKNVLVQGNTVQDTGGPGHGQIMLFSGNGPLSNVAVKEGQKAQACGKAR